MAARKTNTDRVVEIRLATTGGTMTYGMPRAGDAEWATAEIRDDTGALHAITDPVFLRAG